MFALEKNIENHLPTQYANYKNVCFIWTLVLEGESEVEKYQSVNSIVKSISS